MSNGNTPDNTPGESPDDGENSNLNQNNISGPDKLLIGDIRSMMLEKFPDKKQFLAEDRNIVTLNDLANDLVEYQIFRAIIDTLKEAPKLVTLRYSINVFDFLSPPVDHFAEIDDEPVIDELKNLAFIAYDKEFIKPDKLLIPTMI